MGSLSQGASWRKYIYIWLAYNTIKKISCSSVLDLTGCGKADMLVLSLYSFSDAIKIHKM